MAEEKEVKEETKEKEFTVPLFTVDDDVFNQMVESLKEKEKAVTPPEGQIFKGMKAYCDKHGDITAACKMINFTRLYKHGEDLIDFPEQECLCQVCFAEWIREQRAAGKFGKVKLFPVFEDVPKKEEKAEEAPAEK